MGGANGLRSKGAPVGVCWDEKGRGRGCWVYSGVLPPHGAGLMEWAATSPEVRGPGGCGQPGATPPAWRATTLARAHAARPPTGRVCLQFCSC